MQNINSKFKYTIDLGVKSMQSAFKVKKSKKDKVMHILILIFTMLMAGVIAWDIVRDTSFVIDLIILIALVGVEIFSLIMPLIIIRMQKKFLSKLDLDAMDYTETQITKDKCTETYYKDDKIMMQNVCDMTKLYGYQIKDNHIFIVFNNFACAIFDIHTLNISIDDFTQFLDSRIDKNKLRKFK